MEMENIRQVLEDAAQVFLSPANSITNERRREAEKVRWKISNLNVFRFFFFFRFFFNFVDRIFLWICIDF